MGPTASGGRNREGSAMGSFNDSIVVGRVRRKLSAIKLSIVPRHSIHGKTDFDTLSGTNATAAEQDVVTKIRSESHELPKEDSALDLKISKPTQSAPEQEITVEDQCKSAWVSLVLEKQRCHFVHFLAHTAGTAPSQEGSRQMQVEAAKNSDTLDQHEAAGDNNAQDQQEEAGEKEESILGNLSPISDDASSMDTEEYNRAMKELEDEEKAEAESAPPKEVLVTLTGMEQGTDAEATPTNAGIPGPSNSETPQRMRYRIVSDPGEGCILENREDLSIEELARHEGRGAIANSEILTKPVTSEEAADPEALEAKRKELLAAAERFANTAVVMLEERQDAEEVMALVEEKERTAVEYMQKAKALRERWETIIGDASREADRIHREAIRPRKINFASPTDHQPLTTSKDNMKKVAELLDKNDEEIDINHLRTLVASAMKQQRTSTGTRHLCPGTRVLLRHLADVVQPETLDPMGLVELISAGTSPLGGIGTRSAHRSPVGAGTKNASLSPAEAGTREATTIMEKVATEAGVNNKKGAENLKAKAKGLISPLADLPPHHLVEEAKRRPEISLPLKISRPQRPARHTGTQLAGGTPNVACCMLQLYLVGPARTWLSDLEENSIFCWFDLKIAFEKHFRGTYKRPATTSDLQACIQKKNETSRAFRTRWLATRNECENLDNRTAMHAFIGGLQRGGLLRHKLTCLINENNLTLDNMIGIASTHTATDDDAGGELTATTIPLHQQNKNRDGGSSNNKLKNPSDDQKSGESDLVALTFQRGGQGGGRGRGRGGGAGRGQQRADKVTVAGFRAPQTYEEYKDMPCLAHIDPAIGESSHTNRNCKWFNDLKTDPEAGYNCTRKHRVRVYCPYVWFW
ncbi:hypothetical protein QYE76_002107 [Lolium multiflorum]|uniref:Retrotransposon gag domain-containing protein n=1 Tax=Lolium multiflorum TaxID=4521 RepID=A0AAD8RP28_LOLMU|nr:hypothetical protein QYE76_002107 [Lolium multiflorum]